MGWGSRVVEYWERLEPHLWDIVSRDITDCWRLRAAEPVNGATGQQMSDVAESNGKQACGVKRGCEVSATFNEKRN